MLVIHLNSGDKIRTNESFDSVVNQIEDQNIGYITLIRKNNTILDNDYAGKREVKCIVDKDEIAFIDILE